MAEILEAHLVIEANSTAGEQAAGGLRRTVGFYGLMFVSLGSIIGSGWLLGALNAAKVAGPASVLSWLLAAGMLSLLAITYAELGATIRSPAGPPDILTTLMAQLRASRQAGQPGCKRSSLRRSKCWRLSLI
jgi:amino acid permease